MQKNKENTMHFPPNTGSNLFRAASNLKFSIFAIITPKMWSKTGIKRTDNYRFVSDLELVRPIYFAKNVKKIGLKITFFGEVPELKYSRSLQMATNLHNLSKQSHFPAKIHQV